MIRPTSRTHTKIVWALGFSLFLGILVGGLAFKHSTPSSGSKSTEVMKEPECLQEIVQAESPDELVSIGNAYFGGMREYDLPCARMAYSAAIARDPDGNKLMWYQLGRVDFLEGHFDKAVYKLNKQAEYFKDGVPNVHYMLELAYGYRARQTESSGDWSSSESAFKRYIELDPMSPWARVDLAWALFSQGKYEEMKPDLIEGLAKNPDNPWLLNMYGLSLLNTGDATSARDYFQKALAQAETLTPEVWGRSYPGNDPASWSTGLEEMKEAIQKNLLVADRSN